MSYKPVSITFQKTIFIIFTCWNCLLKRRETTQLVYLLWVNNWYIAYLINKMTKNLINSLNNLLTNWRKTLLANLKVGCLHPVAYTCYIVSFSEYIFVRKRIFITLKKDCTRICTKSSGRFSLIIINLILKVLRNCICNYTFNISWLSKYATRRKAAVSIPDEVVGFFIIALFLPVALRGWDWLSL
jgi:hypothetical protein